MTNEEKFNEAIKCFNDVVELVYQMAAQLTEKEERIDELEQQLSFAQAKNEEYYEKEYGREIDELIIQRRI